MVGARALVISQDKDPGKKSGKNKVLLVYHTYCPGWHLPGGGVKRGEHPLQAVRREVFEEAGIRCLKDPEFFGIYYQKYLGVDDYPTVYVIESFTQESVRSPEIKESRWFPLDNLPSDIGFGSFQRIQEYLFKTPHPLAWGVSLKDKIQ